MPINTKPKRLLAAALFSGIGSLNAASAEEASSLAPEATAAEATLAFWDIPPLENAFVDTTPADRKDALIVGELGIDGGDKKTILKLAQEIGDGQHGNYDSLLIAHKGKLLFESYYLRGRINLPHAQASATKAYTGLALGRAIQLGYLTMADLDKPLVSFFSDLDSAKLVDGAKNVTLHKALTMRSGIRVSEGQREEFENNPLQLKGQGQVQAHLEHSEPITEESQSFLYQGIDPNLVMQVIEAVVPGTAEDFIKSELLDKMDITNYRWPTAITGLPQAGSRTSMTSRDMLKWGLLAMNKGQWNGEQLIPEEFIATAINRIVRHSDDENFADDGSVSNIGYGYFWWQADMQSGDKSYFSTSAQGGSGQTVILIDELDLIVVTTVHRLENSVLRMTAERILPAFAQ